MTVFGARTARKMRAGARRPNDPKGPSGYGVPMTGRRPCDPRNGPHVCGHAGAGGGRFGGRSFAVGVRKTVRRAAPVCGPRGRGRAGLRYLPPWTNSRTVRSGHDAVRPGRRATGCTAAARPRPGLRIRAGRLPGTAPARMAEPAPARRALRPASGPTRIGNRHRDPAPNSP